MIRTLFLLLALISAAHGQIYADFTVSHGGTPLGTFRARLDYDKAPRTCANFIGLATGRRPWINVANGRIQTNRPYYDGLTFHRLDHDFVIQGGSPNGLGSDGPGYVIQDEYHANLRHSGRYILSMAKTQLPGTGGSQFFITFGALPYLDDLHSVFGEVISGRELIDNFTNSTLFPTTSDDEPVAPIVMESVAITGPDSNSFDVNQAALGLPVIRKGALGAKRDRPTAPFTLIFDRATQREYIISHSQNLNSWSYTGRLLSRDAASGFELPFPNVNFPRLFMRSAEIDYSMLPNPPPNLLPAGRQFVMTDREGATFSLISNGAGGGTWARSNGSSGTLQSLTIIDGISSNGASFDALSGAHYFPLSNLRAVLGQPASSTAWTSVELRLCFHGPNHGWVQGTAFSAAGATGIRSAFILSP